MSSPEGGMGRKIHHIKLCAWVTRVPVTHSAVCCQRGGELPAGGQVQLKPKEKRGGGNP